MRHAAGRFIVSMKPHRMCGLLVAAIAAVLVSRRVGMHRSGTTAGSSHRAAPGGRGIAHAHSHTGSDGDGYPAPADLHACSDRYAGATHEHTGSDVHSQAAADRCAGTDSDANAAAYTRAAAHQYAGATESNCGLGERGLAGPEQAAVGDGDTFVALGCRRG